MGHGVTIDEVPTGVKPPVQISAGLPVYVGTAPITSVDLTNVNKPKLCLTLADFVAAFGALSDDFDSWTLHEAAKAHFSVYSVAPIVCINILNPTNADHKATATDQSHQLVAGSVPLQVYGGPDVAQLGVIESTVVVKKATVTKTLNVDYTLAFDATGALVVTIKAGGSIGASDVITATFDYLDPSGVTADDVIGGYSAGEYTGLEVIEQVYPALRKVDGFILAPGFSHIPEVAARMAVKAALVDGAFRCQAVTDLPTDGTIATYADAGAWKTNNGYTSVNQVALWPKSKNGDDVYHASTVFACVANVTDAANNGIPFASPSNQPVIGTSAVLDDGTEVLLTRTQANTLNDQGIVTLLNGFFGWRLWGNRTAGYPGTTDPKDAFIPIRRMFNWIGNTIILTTDANVDAPVNRRFIDLVVGTIGSFLNGLIAAGALVDGKIEFRSDENSTTDLSDGKVTWHLTLTPPSPAEQMEFTLEYDPAALAGLFA
jgi:phage tail sheath protein FI